MISTSTLSNVKSDLMRDEGYRDRPYKDSRGFLTIGVGHNLDADGLCPSAILAQLDWDIDTKALEPLTKYLPWWTDQPEEVQRVLINMCFNLGIHSLLGFH